MKKWAILIINITIIGAIAGLYLYSLGIPAKHVSINDCIKHVGEFVSVTGIVWRISHSEDGSFFTVSDSVFSNYVYVYSQFHLQINPGAKVMVKGIVEKYHSHAEITLQSREDITKISEYMHASIPVILENPEKYIGLKLEVSGKIVNPRVSYFNLTDATGYVHGICKQGYVGEREAYFYGTYHNGSFHIKKAYATYTSKTVDIADLPKVKNRVVIIHAKIYDYGISAGLLSHNYTLRVFYKTASFSRDYVSLIGMFIYSSQYGEYILVSGNVK